REVREICQVRRLLECQATRNACGRIDLATLSAIADDLRQLQTRPATSIAAFIHEARLVDSRLHDLIAGSCGNDFLAKELGRLKILFRAFRDVSYIRHEAQNDHRRPPAEAGAHPAIVEALPASDALTASRAMARHIRSGVKYWTRAMPAHSNGSTATPIKG